MSTSPLEHLLLAIMGWRTNPAQALLARHGASREAVLSVLMTVRSPRQVAGQTSEAQGGRLSSMPATLQSGPPRQARPGHRSRREIWRVVQVLLRRTKNNPGLIGEPGVGKTATF